MEWSAEAMFNNFLPGGDLEEFATLAFSEEFYNDGPKSFVAEELSPHLLALKAALNKADYPIWWDAMTGPHADDW